MDLTGVGGVPSPLYTEEEVLHRLRAPLLTLPRLAELDEGTKLEWRRMSGARWYTFSVTELDGGTEVDTTAKEGEILEGDIISISLSSFASELGSDGEGSDEPVRSITCFWFDGPDPLKVDPPAGGLVTKIEDVGAASELLRDTEGIGC